MLALPTTNSPKMKTEKFNPSQFKYEPMKVSIRAKVEETENNIARDLAISLFLGVPIVAFVLITVLWLSVKFQF